MARVRTVQDWLWQDGWFEQRDPKVKLVALFLLTSKKIALSGVYHSSVSRIAEATGLPEEFVAEALRELANPYRKEGVTYDWEEARIFHDFRHDCGWIRGYAEWQVKRPSAGTMNRIRSGRKHLFDEIKEGFDRYVADLSVEEPWPDYNYIETDMWDNDLFADLSWQGKLFWPYLFTNRGITDAKSGVYRLSLGSMAVETGLPRELVVELLCELVECGWVRYDCTHNVLWVKEFLRRQAGAVSIQMVARLKREIRIASPEVRGEFLEYYAEEIAECEAKEQHRRSQRRALRKLGYGDDEIKGMDAERRADILAEARESRPLSGRPEPEPEQSGQDAPSAPAAYESRAPQPQAPVPAGDLDPSCTGEVLGRLVMVKSDKGRSISQSTAEHLVRAGGVALCEEALDHLREELAQGRTIKNPSGFVIAHVKHGWSADRDAGPPDPTPRDKQAAVRSEAPRAIEDLQKFACAAVGSDDPEATRKKHAMGFAALDPRLLRQSRAFDGLTFQEVAADPRLLAEFERRQKERSAAQDKAAAKDDPDEEE